MSTSAAIEFKVSVEHIRTPGLSLEFSLVPWDTDIFGFPVAEISNIKISRQESLHESFDRFEQWCNSHNVHLVSCRVGHECIGESMFLEERGFRFIEMVYPMSCDWVSNAAFASSELTIEPARDADLSALQEIGASAFSAGRFNVDPRIGAKLGGERYAAWIANSMRSKSQLVVKALSKGALVGFFIYENCPNSQVYWHLTAISPNHHGQGVGRSVWRDMVMLHKREQKTTINTTVSARNTPVLNLYARLGFRFESPKMTFHRTRR